MKQKIDKIKLTELFSVSSRSFTVLFTGMILACMLFMFSVWKINNEKLKEEIIELAITAESGFQKSALSKLNADESDVTNPEYKEIKISLMRISAMNDEIEYAYIFVKKNGKIYFLADSEPDQSEFYSPPGQEYYEANNETFKAFEDENVIVSEPITDRWGTWISALVPMKDADTGQTVAVFGLDYPADLWFRQAFSQTVQTGVAVLLFLLLSFAVYVALLKNKELLSHERSRTVFFDSLPGMAYRCRFDRAWTMEFVSGGCYELTGYKPKDIINNRLVSFNDIIAEQYRELLWNQWIHVLNRKEQFKHEYEIVTASGARKWVLEVAQGVFDRNGNVEALEGIIIDITETKQNQMQIDYINNHDMMTGLYNRKYFEKSIMALDREQYYPLSIIVGDINGVRFLNDAYGHSEGDAVILDTAGIIRRRCSEKSIVARTGGGEFSILLPNTRIEELQLIVNRIGLDCKLHSSSINGSIRSINISMGYATKTSKDISIDDVEKEAHSYMLKRKLLAGSSYHSSVISSIMATLVERSQETEEHAQRLASISRKIGGKLGLTQKDIDELQLFAMLHDIGKVGIDSNILNKPGRLDEDEMNIMRKHPEIGCRIAASTDELKPVAQYILTHHERWDGKGYPGGISNETIPMLSRILAVADAYDAMTEDRVYRKKMSKEQAVEQITINSGTQFDPEVVAAFLKIVDQIEF